MSGRRRRNPGQLADGEVIALIYTRVSSDDQEKDGMSLPVQDAECKRYVADREMVLGGVYQDVQTGANPTRADYQRMLAEARALRSRDKRVAIICVLQSRFGRDLEELARAWKELVKQLGVELHATRDGGQCRDELTFGIRGVMVQRELTVISEGVARSFARTRAAGWLKPGRRRWGYAWEDATDEQRRTGSPTVVPVPHPQEAEYVRELFERRASGASYRQLTTWVQSLPDDARGRSKKGATSIRQMSVSSIKDVLDSPVYVARNAPDDPNVDVLDTAPGRWEPLCDDETWLAIHPRRGARENPVPVASPRGEYPLTHFLFCVRCGARMSGQIRRGTVRKRPGRRDYRSKDERIYICTSRMSGAEDTKARGGKPCYRTITAHLIERRIFEQIGALLAAVASPGFCERARAASRDAEQRAAATGGERRLINARDDRKKLSDARADLLIRLSLGEIDDAAYREGAARLGERIDALDAEIVRLGGLVEHAVRRQQQLPQIELILDQASYWRDELVDGALDGRRAILRLLLERATPRRIAAGAYVAGMELTSLGRHLLEVASALLVADGRVEAVQLAWANCTTSTRPVAA